VQAIAKSNHVPVLYTHLVGTQDEVIFDGASFAVDSQGEISFELPAFEHRLGFCELTDQGFKGECCVPSSYLIKTQSKAKINEKLWSALVLATKDYVRRSGFSRIVLGLSGGIDSALVLAIAVDALGAENVEVLLMPSKFNSYISKEDALALIKNFGVKSRTIPIDEMMGLYRQQIGASQAIPLKDITQENIQARTRGNLLMAISSETNSLVLTTGNKSELATGYCTLYGDMCGAFAVIKDLYKTQVFELATWFNAKSQKQFIPERVINRAPSAELRENQTDQDSLPPYDRLDQILFHLIEKRSSTEDIVQAGFERETVQHIVKLLQNSEFKRKQGALGPKVSSCAFGKDWRYPLLNDFRL
jgi:NAD+ synthase (glutamine-hydrolysing)